MEEQITEEVRTLVMNLQTKCDAPIDLHNMFDICVLNVLWAMIAGKRFELEDARLRELMGKLLFIISVLLYCMYLNFLKVLYMTRSAVMTYQGAC